MHVNVVLFHILRDRQHIARIASHSLTQRVHLQNLVEMVFGVASFQHKEQVFEVGERVRLEVRKEGYVVFVLKSVTERERVQTDLHCILVVVFVTRDHLVVPIVVRLYTNKRQFWLWKNALI